MSKKKGPQISTFAIIAAVGAIAATILNNPGGAAFLLLLAFALMGLDFYLLWLHGPNEQQIQYMMSRDWRYLGEGMDNHDKDKPRWRVLRVKGSSITVDVPRTKTPSVTIPYSIFKEVFEEYDKS